LYVKVVWPSSCQVVKLGYWSFAGITSTKTEDN